VYGTVVRNYLHPWFYSEEAQGLSFSFIEKSLIIVCLPPLDDVVSNIEANDQMSGVAEHIGEIYGLYNDLLSHLAINFPNNVFHYDYTQEDDLANLRTMIHAHATRHNRKKAGRVS
jgi:hypothetical protein